MSDTHNDDVGTSCRRGGRGGGQWRAAGPRARDTRCDEARLLFPRWACARSSLSSLVRRFSISSALLARARQPVRVNIDQEHGIRINLD